MWLKRETKVVLLTIAALLGIELVSDILYETHDHVKHGRR